jgi:hypothetical protein
VFGAAACLSTHWVPGGGVPVAWLGAGYIPDPGTHRQATTYSHSFVCLLCFEVSWSAIVVLLLLGYTCIKQQQFIYHSVDNLLICLRAGAEIMESSPAASARC